MVTELTSIPLFVFTPSAFLLWEQTIICDIFSLMAQYKSNIYEAYKPLRNHLRNCGLVDSLRVIRAYAQNLQIKGEDFPSDIEVKKEYLQRDHIQKMSWISEWNLEVLAKEVIINSSENSYNKKTFKEWKFFSTTINKLKDIDSMITKAHVNGSNIFRELERIAHCQFAWQIDRPNTELIARYYRIYKTPEMDSILKFTTGLTTKELYFVGLVIWAHFLSNFALQLPLKIEINGLYQESIDKFLKHFSSELPVLREKLKSEQNMNENYIYSFSSLRSYPIIITKYRGKESLICPIPTLLFWRIASGLYYEVVNQSDFDNAFGSSFQKYIGDCIIAANTNYTIKAFPEESFVDGKNRKDSVDWIVDDGTSAIFIECKAKRMTMLSKTELLISDALEKDLEKMSIFVTQVYKTIRDYQNGKYPTYKFNEQKKIYPLVVTLEDWHLFGDNPLLKMKIEEKLKAEGIPLECLSSMPYTICSTQEFEEMIQIIQSKGIDPIIGKKLEDPEKITWEMATFLLNEYPEEHKNIKPLFKKDFDSIFPEEIAKKRELIWNRSKY